MGKDAMEYSLNNLKAPKVNIQ